MRNLTVENVYTRQSAKELTKRHFWKLLCMMLTVFAIICAVMVAGVLLLSMATGASWETTVSSSSYSAQLDPATVGTGFFIGYAVLMLVVTLVGGGLSLGLIHSIIGLCRGETVKVGSVFSRMKYCLKAFGLSIWVGFKTMLWALPGILVMMAATVFIVTSASAEATELTASQSVVAMVLSLLPLLMMILIFALVLPAMYRYLLSTYILADEPETGVFDCVKRSKVMMKGHKWQAFKLTIPFFLALYGWMFLIVLGMSLLVVALGETVEVLVIVLPLVLFVVMMLLVLIYGMRTTLAYCLFYLKRKGDMPAVPPEEEERIVAWEPAAEKTASESVATNAANIGCWNPGGEVKPEKE